MAQNMLKLKNKIFLLSGLLSHEISQVFTSTVSSTFGFGSYNYLLKYVITRLLATPIILAITESLKSYLVIN